MSTIVLLVAAVLRHPVMQVLSVIGGTFILEDAATVITAMQVQAGAIPFAIGLCALYAGIVLGDLGLYGMGRLAALVPWMERFIPPRRRDIGRDWLAGRLARVILISRFVPGLRLPTYTTCGFLKASFLIFTLTAILGTLVWTSLLFGVSMKLGHYVLAYMGAWRWAGIGVFCLTLLAMSRLLARQMKGKVTP
jgi:membrane protein DedA with SNARE-associated domain